MLTLIVIFTFRVRHTSFGMLTTIRGGQSVDVIYYVTNSKRLKFHSEFLNEIRISALLSNINLESKSLQQWKGNKEFLKMFSDKEVLEKNHVRVFRRVQIKSKVLNFIQLQAKSFNFLVTFMAFRPPSSKVLERVRKEIALICWGFHESIIISFNT